MSGFNGKTKRVLDWLISKKDVRRFQLVSPSSEVHHLDLLKHEEHNPNYSKMKL